MNTLKAKVLDALSTTFTVAGMCLFAFGLYIGELAKRCDK